MSTTTITPIPKSTNYETSYDYSSTDAITPQSSLSPSSEPSGAISTQSQTSLAPNVTSTDTTADSVDESTNGTNDDNNNNNSSDASILSESAILVIIITFISCFVVLAIAYMLNQHENKKLKMEKEIELEKIKLKMGMKLQTVSTASEQSQSHDQSMRNNINNNNSNNKSKRNNLSLNYVGIGGNSQTQAIQFQAGRDHASIDVNIDDLFANINDNNGKLHLVDESEGRLESNVKEMGTDNDSADSDIIQIQSTTGGARGNTILGVSIKSIDESKYENWSQKQVLVWVKLHLSDNGIDNEKLKSFLIEWNEKYITGKMITQFIQNENLIDDLIGQFSKENRNFGIWMVIKTIIFNLKNISNHTDKQVQNFKD